MYLYTYMYISATRIIKDRGHELERKLQGWGFVSTTLDSTEATVCGEKKVRLSSEVSGNLLQLSH